MLVNVGGRERTTDEYATLLARSGLQLAQTIPLGRVEAAMGHHLNRGATRLVIDQT